jgi:hypothetical protein
VAYKPVAFFDVLQAGQRINSVRLSNSLHPFHDKCHGHMDVEHTTTNVAASNLGTRLHSSIVSSSDAAPLTMLHLVGMQVLWLLKN